MAEPTRKQIERFVRIRNKSGFNSNLQFMSDAREAGFAISDLPAAVKLESGGYEWTLSIGVLREECGEISFTPHE